MPDRWTPGPFYRAMSRLDDVSYILSDKLQILRVNPAWTRFAEGHGGLEKLGAWGRGSFVLDGVSDDLRAAYRDLHEEALSSNRRAAHDYVLASDPAGELYRMYVIPIAHRFLVVTHARRFDLARADGETYRRDGVVVACAECKRVRTQGDGERWDFVANYLEIFALEISHGLCPLCATYALLSAP